MAFFISEDLHTHTQYSHGKGTIEDNVRQGISKKLKRIGITDHGPGHFSYGLKREKLPEMRAEVDRLNEKYPEIEILLGVEANIVNTDGSLDLLEEDYQYLDYVIAGYHYAVLGKHPLRSLSYIVRNWLAYKLKLRPKALTNYNTDLVISAIKKNDLIIITHLGDKAPVNIEEIAEVCKETDTLVELNSHHKAPTVEEIASLEKVGVDFILSSDAHNPAHVAVCEESIDMALEAGIDMARIVNLKGEGSS